MGRRQRTARRGIGADHCDGAGPAREEIDELTTRTLDIRSHVTAATLVAVLAVALAPPARATIGAGYVDWYWGNPSPQGNLLSNVDFAGGRGYAAGDCTVLRSDDGGQTWSGLPSGVLTGIDRMQVIDGDTIVVLGNCVLRRSDDGGATFRRIFFPVEYECQVPVEAMSFADKRTGYLALRDGSVMRTADGGETFARQTAVPGTPTSCTRSR